MKATHGGWGTSRARSTCRSPRCIGRDHNGFADGDQLRAQIAKQGVLRGRRLVCYDGSGVAAAKLAFVLTLLGHEDVAVYDGGWAEWGDRLDLPVER